MKRFQFNLSTLILWSAIMAVGFGLNHLSDDNKREELISDAALIVTVGFIFYFDRLRKQRQCRVKGATKIPN